MGEVASELVEHGGRRLRRASLRGACRRGLLAIVALQQLQDGVAHRVEVGAEPDEHLGGDTLTLPDEAEQQMLGADVGVVHLERLTQAELQHLLGTRGEGDVTGGGRRATADDLLDLGAHRLQRDPQRGEGLGGDAFPLTHQSEQQMLGAYVIVVQRLGLVLGQDDDPTRPV